MKRDKIKLHWLLNVFLSFKNSFTKLHISEIFLV